MDKFIEFPKNSRFSLGLRATAFSKVESLQLFLKKNNKWLVNNLFIICCEDFVIKFV